MNVLKDKRVQEIIGLLDEAQKAAAAREEFKQWKKQVSAVASAQKKRLERALVTGRK